MSKRWLLSLVPSLGLLAFVGCAAPAPTATPTQPPVAAATPTKAAPTPTKAPTATPTKRPLVKGTVAVPSRFLTQLTWVVAEAKGYFQEEGLDPDITVVTGGGKAALAAVAGQSAHLTTAAAPEVYSAVAQGQPVQAVAQALQGEPYSLAMRPEVAKSKGLTEKSSLVEKVNALRGLTLGATNIGGGSDFAARFILAKFGLDPERDVEMTYPGSANLVPAIEAGRVDAAVHTEPEMARAVGGGSAIYLVQLARDFPETRINVNTMISTHKNVIASQPEIPEAFVRALWRAIRLLKTNRADAEEAYRKLVYPELDVQVFKLAFDFVYTLHLPDSPAVTREGFEAGLNYRNKMAGGEPLSVRFEDFYTPKFIEAAKKQLGY